MPSQRQTTIQGYTLPNVIDPPERWCVMVPVPKDQWHMAAFLGAIFELTQWTAWQRDADKRGTLAATVWRDIFSNLQFVDCQPQNVAGGRGGGVILPMFRQNPDNPCLLEVSLGNDCWCTVFDASKCQNFGSQPGHGGEEPAPGGGKANTCAVLYANQQLLLPWTVNAGDTIEVTDANGAGWDGGEFDFGALWRCPDGEQFIAGKCVNYTRTIGTDPVPSANHMSLVIAYGPTPNYLAAPIGTPVVIPSGVVNAQVWLQVNDSDLTNNQGSYNVCTQITNNATKTWAHTFYFPDASDPWTAFLGTNPCPAVWVPGAGLEPCSSGGNSYNDWISNTFPSTAFTGFTVSYHLDAAPSAGIDVQHWDGGTIHYTALPTSAGDHTETFTLSQNVSLLYLIAEGSDASMANMKWISITLRGTGADPWA